MVEDHSRSILVRWISSPMFDLIADSAINLIIHSESSPYSVKSMLLRLMLVSHRPHSHEDAPRRDFADLLKAHYEHVVSLGTSGTEFEVCVDENVYCVSLDPLVLYCYCYFRMSRGKTLPSRII